MGKGRVKKAQLNAEGNLAMDWHPIPSASVCHYCTFLFQFFIKNEGNQMDTVSGKPNELLGGGVTLQWIGIPSPMLQFTISVPFCSNSSLKMKETKWTQCQESLMKCWGVQTSSTHLLFWVERIGFQPQLGHGVMTLGKKLYSHHTFFHPVL